MVLVCGALGLALFFRGRARTAAPADRLTDDERARIERLLGNGNDDGAKDRRA